MTHPIVIELLPVGRKLTVEQGTALQDVLYDHGVEFPCGGQGRCKGCRVRVVGGRLEPSEQDLALLGAEEIRAGWRLACQGRAEADLRIELEQWEAVILADDSTFEVVPGAGLGVAVDVGTTTLVGQLLDRSTGHVLGVSTALNPQAQHGADIMTRIEFGRSQSGLLTLGRLIRERIGRMLSELLQAAGRGAGEVVEVVLVGNTVMHHLFCGLEVEPLAAHPFEPEQAGEMTLEEGQLGWDLNLSCPVRFLPCLGGFVGSDILAGILATRLHRHQEPAALIDLGTNGEIVVGNRERLVCASTAAGPAFEGARISQGMRAVTGAISEVQVEGGELRCRVLGNVAARGICGSGLVDAVAAGLDLGRIQPGGKITGSDRMPLAGMVVLRQKDVRELQLAKGAIAAGLRLLAERWGVAVEGLSRIYLAGAFGNYINRTSAHRIGLIRLPPARVQPVGNAALHGAKMVVFGGGSVDYGSWRGGIAHVSLNEDPRFHEVYLEEMGFAPGYGFG